MPLLILFHSRATPHTLARTHFRRLNTFRRPKPKPKPIVQRTLSRTPTRAHSFAHSLAGGAAPSCSLTHFVAQTLNINPLSSRGAAPHRKPSASLCSRLCPSKHHGATVLRPLKYGKGSGSAGIILITLLSYNNNTRRDHINNTSGGAGITLKTLFNLHDLF